MSTIASNPSILTSFSSLIGKTNRIFQLQALTGGQQRKKYPDRGGAVGPTCEEVGDSLSSVLATWAARWQGESSDALRLRSEEDMERQI